MLEELAIKLSERESLIKSFILFFGVIEIFLVFIFYNYYKIEKEHLQEQLFLEMKNYSFFFKDERFDIDVVDAKKDSKLYELHFDKESLFILTPLEQGSLLKIYYPIQSYEALLEAIEKRVLLRFVLLSIVAIIIAFAFSLYSLSPLKESLKLLEEFIKDIIHDLNTPLTSIMINLKMMDKNDEEVKSIAQSVNVISMLHKNLDTYLKNTKFDSEKFSIKNVVTEHVEFFSGMYDYLKFEIDLDDKIIKSDKNAFGRIIYNLLSNACKYNTTNGFIKIILKENTLSISNDSYGIKNSSKIFDRFYKEDERGLGIGLHIVEKLCKELNVEKKFDIDKNIVTISLNLEQII
jgi:two-component system OmpR family sensor kinase